MENNMENPKQIRVSIDFLQEEIVRHFDGFEEVIKEMVKTQMNSTKIIELISEGINKHFSFAIERAVDDVVAKAIKNNKKIHKKIEKIVDEVAKKELKLTSK